MELTFAHTLVHSMFVGSSNGLIKGACGGTGTRSTITHIQLLQYIPLKVICLCVKVYEREDVFVLSDLSMSETLCAVNYCMLNIVCIVLCVCV